MPGVSRILFIVAVRDAGSSRAAILIGTAPLISVAIALALFGEPFRTPRALGTMLVVAGGATLARERTRPRFVRNGIVSIPSTGGTAGSLPVATTNRPLVKAASP